MYWCRCNVIDIFLDFETQKRIQTNLKEILLELLKPPHSENDKSNENRRDNTLSSIPNLSSNSNECWRQVVAIVGFVSELFLTSVLAEVASVAPLSSVVQPPERLRDLKLLRETIINLIGSFVTPDEDNVTCIDLWLNCAFWSPILSRMQHLLEFNVGGKRELMKRVFSAALREAFSGTKRGSTNVFSLWLGSVATACLQPKLVSEIGVWALHKAIHSPAILACMPSKWNFLTSCFLRMKSLRSVNVSHYIATRQLKEQDKVSGTHHLASSQEKVEEGEVVQSVDWQLFMLHTFSMVAAVQLNDLPLSERRDVKEKQLEPLLDMFRR